MTTPTAIAKLRDALNRIEAQVEVYAENAEFPASSDEILDLVIDDFEGDLGIDDEQNALLDMIFRIINKEF